MDNQDHQDFLSYLESIVEGNREWEEYVEEQHG